jgi:hypothetical protein
MEKMSNKYLLKEYGSWSVLIVSYLIGIGVSRLFDWKLFPLFIALGLLVNSKQAYGQWQRSKSTPFLAVFFGQAAVAGLIMLAVFGQDVYRLLPLLVFPAAYLLSGKLAGEHFLLTELFGFALLSLAAVLAKLLLTNGLDVRLFLGTGFYFMAGIFKIKALLFRKTSDRVLTVLFLLLTIYVYHRMHIPWIILLPLADNLVAALTLYKVRLRTTGAIEVVKSLIVLALFVAYY